jgi:hypothetical protein
MKTTKLSPAVLIIIFVIVTSLSSSKDVLPSRVGYLSINQLVNKLPDYRKQRSRLSTKTTNLYSRLSKTKQDHQRRQAEGTSQFIAVHAGI